MSAKDNGICDCAYFEEGDWVESRLNSDIFGIVVGQNNFGQFYTVQLAGSLTVQQFSAVTLRHMDDFGDEPGGSKETPPTEESNVINFTKARDLRTAKTKGAA